MSHTHFYICRNLALGKIHVKIYRHNLWEKLVRQKTELWQEQHVHDFKDTVHVCACAAGHRAHSCVHAGYTLPVSYVPRLNLHGFIRVTWSYSTPAPIDWVILPSSQTGTERCVGSTAMATSVWPQIMGSIEHQTLWKSGRVRPQSRFSKMCVKISVCERDVCVCVYFVRGYIYMSGYTHVEVRV